MQRFFFIKILLHLNSRAFFINFTVNRNTWAMHFSPLFFYRTLWFLSFLLIWLGVHQHDAFSFFKRILPHLPPLSRLMYYTLISEMQKFRMRAQLLLILVEQKGALTIPICHTFTWVVFGVLTAGMYSFLLLYFLVSHSYCFHRVSYLVGEAKGVTLGE